MTTEQTTLRQAFNDITIEGLLVEMNLEEKVSQAKEKYIAGKLSVEVAENEVHTVRVYCKELKKDGSENKLYKGLQTVVNEYVSVAKVGREEADKVTIKNGQFGINDYVSGGQLKSYPEITTNKIQRVKNLEKYNPRAEFNVEMFIKSINEEIDKDENETGRVKIKAYIPVFGGKIAPLEFVTSNDVSSYIRDTFENGHTVRFNGKIINRVEVTETKKSGGFGKPVNKVTEKYIREFLIEGGNEEPYEEDDVNTYDKKVIQKALTEREVYLEGLVKQAEEKDKNGNKGTNKSEKKGFGKPVEEEKTIDISDDDLPF